WNGLRGKGEDKGTAARAHRNALDAPEPADESLMSFVHQVETVLSGILEIFEKRFLDSFPLLDELLAKKKPTRENAKAIRNRVPNNPITLSYFFEKLDNPAWLDPLFKESHFKYPPRAVVGGGYPQWPASRYLARMAAKPECHNKVLDIALAIPATDNP